VDKAPMVNDYARMTAEEKSGLWRVRLDFRQILPGTLAEKLSDALEDIAAAISLHNRESTEGDDWTLTLTTTGLPDKGDILARIGAVAATEGLPPLLAPENIHAEKLPPTDWLKHVHDNFPPVQAGPFFIYGSHYAGALPTASIGLRIDAATAFGSGEHETTKGCLIALAALAQGGARFDDILDMGCGSGILAIAAAKLWPAAGITAADIDPEAVAVTLRHARMNGVEDRIRAAAGDGYATPLVARNAPYDLVMANILADPLMEMAPALSGVLKKGGEVVLSGLLARQKDLVAEAHARAGLHLANLTDINGWLTLTLRKEGRPSVGEERGV
jgi:ribosomal protein L11 methyltransferase